MRSRSAALTALVLAAVLVAGCKKSPEAVRKASIDELCGAAAELCKSQEKEAVERGRPHTYLIEKMRPARCLQRHVLGLSVETVKDPQLRGLINDFRDRKKQVGRAPLRTLGTIPMRLAIEQHRQADLRTINDFTTRLCDLARSVQTECASACSGSVATTEYLELARKRMEQLERTAKDPLGREGLKDEAKDQPKAPLHREAPKP